MRTVKAMKEKSKKFFCISIFLSIVIIAGLIIVKLLNLNNQLRSKIPYLLPNEKITYFTLLDKDAERIDASVLTGPKPSVIVIFSRPCSKCSKSIFAWKKIAALVKDEVNVYGIVLDSLSAAFEFEETTNLNFKIYVPEDIPKFKAGLRVILNYSMTMVYLDGVKSLKLGDLETVDAGRLIKLLRQLIQNKKEQDYEET